MVTDHRPLKLAVLIDAQNIGADIADALFAKICEIGEASVRRIYGDFSGNKLADWKDRSLQHALLPRHLCIDKAKKNTADIALAIDAMDLLFSGRFDGFCLVSSDRDFASLAMRIREQGLAVYGFGGSNTPHSLRNACIKYFTVDGSKIVEDKNSFAATKPDSHLKPPSAAVKIIRSAFGIANHKDGWINVEVLETLISNVDAEFDPRIYRCETVIQLIKKNSNVFEVHESSQSGLRARLKCAAKTAVTRPLAKKPS